MSKSKSQNKKSKLSKDSTRLAIITPEAYEKMNEREQLATQMSFAHDEINKGTKLQFWRRDEVKQHVMLQAVAVRAKEEQGFRFDFDNIRFDRHYWSIRLFILVFFPTMTESDAKISVCLKHEGYVDPEKQRFMQVEGPVNSMWAMVGSMPNYISVEDSDKVSLYVLMKDLDIRNVDAGQLKMYTLISCSDMNIAYEKLPPFVKYFLPFENTMKLNLVMKSIEDSLLRLKLGKDSYLKSKFVDIIHDHSGSTDKLGYTRIDTEDRINKYKTELKTKETKPNNDEEDIVDLVTKYNIY